MELTRQEWAEEGAALPQTLGARGFQVLLQGARPAVLCRPVSSAAGLRCEASPGCSSLPLGQRMLQKQVSACEERCAGQLG